MLKNALIYETRKGKYLLSEAETHVRMYNLYNRYQHEQNLFSYRKKKSFVESNAPPTQYRKCIERGKLHNALVSQRMRNSVFHIH